MQTKCTTDFTGFASPYKVGLAFASGNFICLLEARKHKETQDRQPIVRTKRLKLTQFGWTSLHDVH